MTAPSPAPAGSLPASGRPGGDAPPGFPLGSPFGVPVFLSPSWLVFAAAITFLYAPDLERLDGVGRVSSYALALAFAVLLGLSVLAHELSHLLVARGLGLPVRRVTLFLLGGVTEIDEEPQTPAREYLVAVAGPATSLFLAATGTGVGLALPEGSVARAVALLVALSNAAIVVFNLLPGLPLDGGRVLRAGVWRLSGDKHRGTAVAARSGQVLAVLVVLAVLLGVPLVTGAPAGIADAVIAGLLGAFIWASATQSLRAGALASRLPGLTVRSLVRRAVTVPADLPLAEALRRAHEAQAGGVVVVDRQGRPDAVVAEADVSTVPEPRRPWTTVGALARRIEAGLVLTPDLEGEELVRAMREHPASEYVVLDPSGGVLGVVAASDVARRLGLRVR